MQITWKFCSYQLTLIVPEAPKVFMEPKTSVKGTITELATFAKWDDTTKGSCQGTKDFVTWQKIVGIQTFSMASLTFDYSWENFSRWKMFALEIASCWQMSLQNKRNLNRAYILAWLKKKDHLQNTGTGAYVAWRILSVCGWMLGQMILTILLFFLTHLLEKWPM